MKGGWTPGWKDYRYTMNVSSSESMFEEYANISTDWRVLLAPEIFTLALFPFGLLANGVFLFFVTHKKSRRTPFNIFLSNISVAGVFFLVLALAFTLVSDKEDPFLRGFCFLFSIVYVASGLFVTIVAAERFLAVCFPVRYSTNANNRRRAGKICAAAWLTATACGGLVKLVVYLFRFQKKGLLFVIGFFCLAFLILNSILYACVFWQLWRHPLASSSVQRRVVIKLAVTTFVVFAVDSTHVVYISLHYFFEENLDKTSFEMIILALNAVSSTVNPLVYGLLNFDLQKRSVRNALRRWCCRLRGTQEDKDNQPPSRSFRRTLDQTPIQTLDQAPIQTLDDQRC